MILISEIKLNNFLSHAKTEISFKENEKLLLDGVSGSGKSSIVEAILWCLYGRSRTDNRSIIRRGEKAATVSVKFVEGQSIFNITRSVSSTGKNTLSVTKSVDGGNYTHIERNGIKDIQDWIETEFLRASYELFTNSIAYPQDNENSFVKATATKRKDLLLEIVRAGNFDVLYEKARDAYSNEETQLSGTILKIDGFKKIIQDLEPVAAQVEDYEKEVKKTTEELVTLDTEKAAVEVVLNTVSSSENKIKENEKLENRISLEISRRKKEIESNDITIGSILSYDVEAAKKMIEESKTLQIEAGDIGGSLRENAERQSKLNQHMVNKPNVFDYTKDIENINKQLIPLIKESCKCPAGEACPFVIPIKGQIAFLSEQIQDKERKTAESMEANRKWNEEYHKLPPALGSEASMELYNRLEKVKIRIRDLSSKGERVILEYETALKNGETLKLQNKNLRESNVKDLAEINLLQEDTKKLSAHVAMFDLQVMTGKILELTIKIRNILTLRDRSIRYHETALQARISLKKAQDEVSMLSKGIEAANERLEALGAIKEAFSPRGVKAVVIDYLVPNLEERINGVLGVMSDFRIHLDTQKATADEEGTKEGLFITVINDRNEELSFDNYSGGEKVKITIAISEALASLMTSVGFRLMDENIVSLDRESTESFVLILNQLQDKFNQLIVVSHLPEVKDIFEKKITIRKINGISKIS